MREEAIISEFSNYSSWLSFLVDMDETLWSKPITEGKWSISEIIAHITNWDHHLLSEVIPSVLNEKGIEFPEFDNFNKTASDYAKSCISKSKLLEEAAKTRELLVKKLHEIPAEKLTKSTTANGVTHCPHTGTPYSLIYIVKEFIDHDHHHQDQITKFLDANNIE